MRKILFGSFVLALVAGGFISSSDSARAAETPYFTPGHVWVDNVATPLPDIAVTFHGFDSLAGHAVTHGTAPAFLPVDPAIRVVAHCQAPRPVGESAWVCDTKGELGAVVAAGEYSMSISIIEDVEGTGVTRYTGTVPITVCDGPCSDLFSLAVSPQPLRYLVDTDLASQAQGSVDFNVDWNATEWTFGSPLDGSGTPAPGAYDLIAEPPRNGAHFGFRGSFSEVGEYSLEVAVTDEFGVVHTDTVPVIICGDAACMQGAPTLASTGLAQNAIVVLGIALLLAGLILRKIRLRRSAR